MSFLISHINHLSKLHVRGITLIETLVVIVLLMIVGSISTPMLFQTLEDQSQTESRRISQVINLLRNEAILGRRQYQLVFSPKDQGYSIFVIPKEGDKVQLKSPKILSPYKFPESFVFHNTYLNQTELIRARSSLQFMSKDSAQKAVVTIDNSGFVSPFFLLFKEDSILWSIYSEGILGKIKTKNVTNEN